MCPCDVRCGGEKIKMKYEYQHKYYQYSYESENKFLKGYGVIWYTKKDKYIWI